MSLQPPSIRIRAQDFPEGISRAEHVDQLGQLLNPLFKFLSALSANGISIPDHVQAETQTLTLSHGVAAPVTLKTLASAKGALVMGSDQALVRSLKVVPIAAPAPDAATTLQVTAYFDNPQTVNANVRVMFMPDGHLATANPTPNDPWNNVFFVHHAIEPFRPSPSGLFPQGDDLSFDVSGPADLHLKNLPTDCIGKANLTGGAGAQTIATSDTSGLAGPATLVSLLLEPDSATNSEVIPHTAWSIVDGNHLSITPTKNHTANFTVRQVGGTFFDVGQIAQFNMPMPSTTVEFWNAAGVSILKIDQQANGDPSIRFFHFDGSQQGRFATNGSGMDYLAVGGTGSGGVRFAGQAASQKPLYQFYDNLTDLNLAASIDSNAGGIRPGVCTVATLGTPTNNVMRFATDATRPSDPTVGGGTGGLCIRANGRWYTP